MYLKSPGIPRESYLAPGDPAHFVWNAPGSRVRIRLTFEAIRRIREYLTAPSDRPSNREREGLLIGKADLPEVQIDNFVPLLADEFGSHFVGSKFGRRDLRNYIEELNHLSGRVPVVGYFRGDGRKGIRLFDEDLAFFREYFPGPSNVFLVVRPGEVPHPSAGFFFWQNDNIFAACSLMEFAFDERTLASVPSRNGTVASQVTAPAETVPAGSVGEKSFRDPAVPRLRAVSAGLALTSGLVLGAYFIRSVVKTPIAPDSSSSRVVSQSFRTGLSVLGSGKEINLVWNGQVPIIAAARVGMLTIKDGELRREVPLTPDQLRSGGFRHTLQGNMSEITLEVFAHDGSVTRDTLTLISNTDAPSTAVAPATSAPMASPIKGPADTTQSERRRDPVRSFVPPASRLNTAVPLVEPQMEFPPSQPAARVDLPRLDSSVNHWPAVPNSPQIAPEKPALPPAKPPEQPQTVSLPLHRPPVPIRQVKPLLPPNVQRMLSSRATIQIRVQVDAAGKVTAAGPLATSGSMGKFLGAAAANAARMWTFEPANDGHRRVPGELMIEFTFVPEK